MFETVARRTALAVAGGIAAILLASGAGALAQTVDLSPEQAGRPRADRNDAIAALIPKDYAFVEDGVLTIAAAPGTPPITTYATDARTVVGADPDVIQLVADVLGKRLVLVPVAWEDWPLGLASGKFDAVVSNVGVTEERKLRFDFSTYRQGLHGFYVAEKSPVQSIREPKDIAGLRIIVGAGTNQERILLEWNRQNEAAGLVPAELQYYDDDAAWPIALKSGRADAEIGPNATLAYQAAVHGGLRSVGTVSSGWPLPAEVGITTRRGSGLAEPFTAALNTLSADGRYAKALGRWGLGDEAVAVSRTNPPGLPKF